MSMGDGREGCRATKREGEAWMKMGPILWGIVGKAMGRGGEREGGESEKGVSAKNIGEK